MNYESIAIPALDALAALPPNPRFIPWDAHDEEILRKYFGRGLVDADALNEHLHVQRTPSAIEHKAAALGIRRGRP